jgi:RNA polymerase sigma-70 factor (TIGR02960 family)
VTPAGDARDSPVEPTVDRLLARARAGDEQAFAELVEPHRGELRLHCYRILGSLHDAEELLQETLLAAWRGLDGFEHRASWRAWLYRIATNRCLNQVRDQARRPQAERPPGEGPEPPPPSRVIEPVWLEPYPDALLDPADHHARRSAVGLAFMVAISRLPPRQRAVLVLRDVLEFRATEVAAMLDASEASVNGSLRRARAALRADGSELDTAPAPIDREQRAAVEAFTDAFEAGDVEAIVALLSDDAEMTMPPQPVAYLGRDAIGGFFRVFPPRPTPDAVRLVATGANGQPALACYVIDVATGVHHAYGLMVLAVDGRRIARITGFADTSLFARFGLPRSLP